MVLFSDRGFSAVTMREIAAAVGISAPALYNHFESKEALYRAAVSAAFADKATRLLCTLAGPDAALARLGRFVHLVAEAVREDPRFRDLMRRELLDGDDSRLDFLGREVFDPLQRAFMTLLDELRPGCDAFLISELIFGMIKQHDEVRPIHPFLTFSGPTERSPHRIAEQVMQVLTPFFSEPDP